MPHFQQRTAAATADCSNYRLQADKTHGRLSTRSIQPHQVRVVRLIVVGYNRLR